MDSAWQAESVKYKTSFTNGGLTGTKKNIFFVCVLLCVFVFFFVFLFFFCFFFFLLFFFVFCCFFFVCFCFFILKPWQIQPLEIVPLFGLGE